MIINVEKLGKRFNREWIFKDLTYQFSPDHTYAITGPNGSGKSTLLQVLWGQMIPSTGNISFEENNKTIDPAEHYKQVSIATPYMDLVDEFTLREMIDFHFRFKQVRSGLSTEALMDVIELTHAKDKLINQFSSGMKQRLKLGLAFYSACKALYLDEPTTNLDKKSIDWYQAQRERVPAGTLVFIASNQEHEYPSTAQKIDILTYKKGY